MLGAGARVNNLEATHLSIKTFKVHDLDVDDVSGELTDELNSEPTPRGYPLIDEEPRPLHEFLDTHHRHFLDWAVGLGPCSQDTTWLYGVMMHQLCKEFLAMERLKENFKIEISKALDAQVKVWSKLRDSRVICEATCEGRRGEVQG